MRPIAAIIVVVFGVCSITTAARAESSSCKQCREQQQACAKNYAAKTCKTEYDICMKSCQKNSRISQPILGQGVGMEALDKIGLRREDLLAPQGVRAAA